MLHTQCIYNTYDTSYLGLGTFKNQPLLREKILFQKGVRKKEKTLFPWICFLSKCSFEVAQGYQNSAEKGDGADAKQRRKGKAL